MIIDMTNWLRDWIFSVIFATETAVDALELVLPEL
jgi:hypothetical protein